MHFTMYKDNAGEWRWTLRAANHEAIAVSSEGYTTKSSCEYSISLVKSAHTAPVYEA